MGRRSKKSLLETAQEAVGQATHSAQDLAGQVAENVGPTIEAVVESAKDRADDMIVKADGVLHEAATQRQKKKGGKFKKFVLVSLLAAVGGVVVSKLKAKKAQDDNWQTSYTPTPAPRTAAPVPPTAEKPAATDDAGGAEPTEALADAADTPHKATTPDEPADVINVDDVPKH